jgi:hypothetical protein
VLAESTIGGVDTKSESCSSGDFEDWGDGDYDRTRQRDDKGM